MMLEISHKQLKTNYVVYSVQFIQMEAAIIPKYGQDYTNETSSNGQLRLNIMVCFKSNQNRIEYVQVYFEGQSIPSSSKMSNFMKKMILFGLR